MKLWLDESRPCPVGWAQARTVKDALAIISMADSFDACSLDHDLSFKAIWELAPSGQTFVDWMIKKGKVPPEVEIHSQNPIAALRMKRTLSKAGYKSTWRPYGVPYLAI